jgi:hypothetical protein
VAEKPRPVAYHLQPALKQWLKEGVEADLFLKLPDNTPVTWCSPLVVQPKPNYCREKQLTSKMIRASVNLRIPNKFMDRTRVTQNPTVEDFTFTFNNCKIFSKLDMNQAYNQVLLAEESREIATFATP